MSAVSSGGQRCWWERVLLWTLILTNVVVVTVALGYAFNGDGASAELSRPVVAVLTIWGLADLSYSLYRRLIRVGVRVGERRKGGLGSAAGG